MTVLTITHYIHQYGGADHYNPIFRQGIRKETEDERRLPRRTPSDDTDYGEGTPEDITSTTTRDRGEQVSTDNQLPRGTGSPGANPPG